LTLATVLFVLALASSVAAAKPPSAAAGSQPTPKLTAERRKWLYDHGHLRAGAYPLAIYSWGRLDQALALVEQALALDRAAFGDTDELVALSLAELAEIQARRGDFPAARKAAQEVLAIRRKKHPETHWRVTEARVALQKIERWAALPPEKRQQLVKVEQELGDSWERLKPGRFAPVLPQWRQPIEAAVELQRQLFREKDLDYARRLRQLAALVFREGPSDPRRVELLPEGPGNRSGASGRKTPRVRHLLAAHRCLLQIQPPVRPRQAAVRTGRRDLP
jgi:tetratricopeptide (TPR) repeat protein